MHARRFYDRRVPRMGRVRVGLLASDGPRARRWLLFSMPMFFQAGTCWAALLARANRDRRSADVMPFNSSARGERVIMPAFLRCV